MCVCVCVCVCVWCVCPCVWVYFRLIFFINLGISHNTRSQRDNWSEKNHRNNQPLQD